MPALNTESASISVFVWPLLLSILFVVDVVVVVVNADADELVGGDLLLDGHAVITTPCAVLTDFGMSPGLDASCV
jgi:hypothetical protein